MVFKEIYMLKSHFLYYTPAKRSLKGVYRNQHVVGWSVGPLQILRRELPPQFLINSHEIWHICLPWGVDVQDTLFNSGRTCIAMVMAYYGKKIGGKHCRLNYFQIFKAFKVKFGTHVGRRV